jgi:uncharacterized damage-inducible protein DinB
MALRDALLPEFDQEMANTRKTLDRIPDDKLGWKPHEKSMTVGGLVTHLANILHWVLIALEKDSFDLASPEGQARLPAVSSRREALEKFDRNVAAARAAIARATDEQLLKPWTLRSAERTIFALPRVGVLRSFVMNHSIHHRAQLGVYLRLNNVPVPAIYGPSADEGSL